MVAVILRLIMSMRYLLIFGRVALDLLLLIPVLKRAWVVVWKKKTSDSSKTP